MVRLAFACLAAGSAAAALVAPSATMDCQKITSVKNGLVKTDLNPGGIPLPEGLVIGSAANLCVAPRGQFCQMIKKSQCIVGGKTKTSNGHKKERCEYMQNGAKLTAPTKFKAVGETKWVQLSAKQAQITGHAVCWHAPQDHMIEGNDCQVRFNYKLANGSMYRWAVSLGEHNVPAVKGALDSVVVAGKGCIALRYDKKDAKGRAMPLSEGYHARFPVEIRSINILRWETTCM